MSFLLDVHDHPTIQRLTSLAVRITGWFNEFQSYDKDMHTGMGNVNLINVLINENHASLADAREAFRIHADDLAEFIHLQQTFPDFGTWHDAVTNHIHHVSFVISGWRGVAPVIQRYDPEFYIEEDTLAAVAQPHKDQSIHAK